MALTRDQGMTCQFIYAYIYTIRIWDGDEMVVHRHSLYIRNPTKWMKGQGMGVNGKWDKHGANTDISRSTWTSTPSRFSRRTQHPSWLLPRPSSTMTSPKAISWSPPPAVAGMSAALLTLGTGRRTPLTRYYHH